MKSINTDSDSFIAAGLMTGTSLDGIDVAICKFAFISEEQKPFCKLLSAATLPYPDGFPGFIKNIIEKPTWNDISFLHFALPELYAEAIKYCAKSAAINLKDIDLIGMHGQTVWHSPAPREQFGIKNVRSSIQLGSPAVLAKRLDIPVISDFRAGDLALGGEGAPLVPRFDFDFFRSDYEDIICLNIGGMSNITFIPQAATINDLSAFDTGPGNILINLAMQKYFDREFDKNGEIARSGVCDKELLNKLMNDQYINQFPPKSTGREYFNSEYIENMRRNMFISPSDLINTLTHFTADSIIFNIRNFARISGKMYIAGGGLKNTFLMDLIKLQIPKTIMISTDLDGFPPDYKEAVAFAYLAVRSAKKMPDNAPKATGASGETILGSLTY